MVVYNGDTVNKIFTRGNRSLRDFCVNQMHFIDRVDTVNARAESGRWLT